MKIASFGFRTPNIGDDLQVLAASLFLPHIDTLIDRDWMSDAALSEPHLVVMNSWFQLGRKHKLTKLRRRRLAPSPSILPILYGFCLGRDSVLKSDWPDYLLAHGPVGARDTETAAKLNELGIAAHHTACTTAFIGRLLPKVKQASRKGVVFVDLDAKDEARFVPQALRDRAIRISTFPSPTIINDPIARMHRMAAICDVLRTAELVVTRRLHAAVPSTGFGTPAIVILEKTPGHQRRFSGYEDFIPTIWTNDPAASAKVNWDNVKPSKLPKELAGRFDEHLKTLEKLTGGKGMGTIEALATRSRFVLPNPGLGQRPGEIAIDTGIIRVARAATYWTDREITLDMDDFASFGNFNFPVLGRAYGAKEWVEIGPAGSFRTSSRPVALPCLQA